MADQPSTRSIKIADDERGGWSSDRPRRGGPDRPADISTRCRVLAPSEALRYSPASLLLIVSPSSERREAFAERLIQDRGSLLSLERVRRLLAGRVPEEEMDAKAQELLDAAARKRFEAGEPVVVTATGLDPAERERYARLAAAAKRPRHVILIEAGADGVQDEDRRALNDLRRRLDAGELGAEGFQTAMRLGGEAVSELKRIVFAHEPRDE
ncbi:MAG TPA: AAA family ATPase [Thermoleophilaceae bacterium]|nr:AAA family ATPase [Thermoleophilaceae bacterium]